MKSFSTIPEMFFAQVDRYGDRAALLRKRGDHYHSISWRQFGQAVREIACGLVALGLEPGDRVAIMAYNRWEWAVADLAIMTAGGITVPIYHTSTTARTNFILEKTRVSLAFVARSEKAEMLANCEAPVGRIISLDPFGIDSAGACSLDYRQLQTAGAKGLEAEYGQELGRRIEALRSDDCATIIFTSGTTGDPKGVMLSHRNILANAAAGLAAQPVNDEDVFLSFLPLSHAFERTVGQFLMLMAGATIAYAASLRSVPYNMQEVRPTIMLGVPRFFEKMHAKVTEKIREAPRFQQAIFQRALATGHSYRLLRDSAQEPGPVLRVGFELADRLVFGKLRKKLGGRLRFFVSGGAPLAPEITEFFLDAGIKIIEGYGLTENSPIISVNRLDRIRPGTVGPPLPGVELKIGSDGEILVRGPSVMMGYYKDPEATAEAIEDGWLHTGDLGVIEGGSLRIVDRKKEIIVTSGGKNIPPQRVENLIIIDPYISQVMVYGDRRKFLSALIVPDFEQFAKHRPVRSILPGSMPEELADSREVNEFLMSRINERTRDLPSYERVKKILIVTEPFTEESGDLTPTMKLKRKKVLQRYKAELD
ncbi:MAG: long-chain fatty acid--CoA ligase, partial [Deltaproteobacteria bacterium]